MGGNTMRVWCALYGEGDVFSVAVERDALVEALQQAVAGALSDPHHPVLPRRVRLYVARRAHGAWLEENDALQTLLRGPIDTSYTLMRSSRRLDDESQLGPHFEPGNPHFEPGSGRVHVLVAAPAAAAPAEAAAVTAAAVTAATTAAAAAIEAAAAAAAARQSRVWLVRGSVEHALRARGVRYRLYRLAGAYLGYYDPARRSDDTDNALWYEDGTLRFHILFNSEDNALRFENALREEPLMLGSPLQGQVFEVEIREHEAVHTHLRRIYAANYVPQESESPQDTVSSISSSSRTSIVDTASEEFIYQRIEHERLFMPYGKAESCHLMSRKQCNKNKQEYKTYDRDPNSRLALSRDMHGFYDGLCCQVPFVNMSPGAVEPKPSVGKRRKVEVFVKVLDSKCKDLVFSRLKDGSIQTEDPLVMKTFVHVEDPETFCFCLRWKEAENDASWQSFLSMAPAAD